MTEITEDLIRIKAREIILDDVENNEFLDVIESVAGDIRFDGLSVEECEAVTDRINDAINTATVTVTWSGESGEADPDEQALLDILETGVHDGPVLVAVLRSIDGGPDFSDVRDAAEVSALVDRFLEWKNNAVTAALAARETAGTGA